jgi:hypothetical protein
MTPLVGTSQGRFCNFFCSIFTKQTTLFF